MKKSSEVVIYKTHDNQIEVDVFLNNDTVWLNRKQISALFERDVKTIGKHINNVFSDGELDFISVVAKFATTALIAESNPDYKDKMIGIILLLLNSNTN